MNKDKVKNTVQEYTDFQRAELAKSRNARKWFYRGILVTLAAGYVYAMHTKDDPTKDES